MARAQEEGVRSALAPPMETTRVRRAAFRWAEGQPEWGQLREQLLAAQWERAVHPLPTSVNTTEENPRRPPKQFRKA